MWDTIDNFQCSLTAFIPSYDSYCANRSSFFHNEWTIKVIIFEVCWIVKVFGLSFKRNFMAEWYRQHTVICKDQIRTQIYAREDFHNIFCGEYQKFIESKEHQISLLTHFTVIASILHDMPAVWPSNPVTWQQYPMRIKEESLVRCSKRLQVPSWSIATVCLDAYRILLLSMEHFGPFEPSDPCKSIE